LNLGARSQSNTTALDNKYIVNPSTVPSKNFEIELRERVRVSNSRMKSTNALERSEIHVHLLLLLFLRSAATNLVSVLALNMAFVERDDGIKRDAIATR